LEGVSVRHLGSSTWAPQRLSLTPAPGQLTVVTGPSGCGKSSLAALMAGLIPHAVEAVYQGSVTIAQVELADAGLALVVGTVALVGQDPDAQVLTGSVEQEVAYTLENLCQPVELIRSRTAHALAVCGLAELARRDPWTLSGGQRQRLALACGVASGAPVLVLDQPTANIDPVGRRSVYALLRQLADRGQAVVCVETRLDAVLGSTDRLVVLDRQGRLAGDGSPLELLYGDQAAALADWIDLPLFVRLARRLTQAGHAVGRPLSAEQLDARLEPGQLESLLGPAQPYHHHETDPLASDPLEPDQVDAPLEADQTDTPLEADRPHDLHETDPLEPDRPHAPLEPDRPHDRLGPDPLAPDQTAAAAEPGPGALLLWLDRVSVGSPDRPRLSAADLELRAGSVHALVGANGAGKTTLLSTVTGAVRPRSGRVQFWRADGQPARRRDSVGLCCQNPENQFTKTTLAAEFESAWAGGSESGPLDPTQRRDLLAAYGLTESRSVSPFLLSGGQKRQLSLALALAANRPLLVLDEPTAGQDRAGRAELAASLRRYAAHGAGVLLATHDLELVAERTDQVTVLAQGRVLASGPTRAILAQPELFRRAGLRPPPAHLVALTRPPAERTAPKPSSPTQPLVETAPPAVHPTRPAAETISELSHPTQSTGRPVPESSSPTQPSPRTISEPTRPTQPAAGSATISPAPPTRPSFFAGLDPGVGLIGLLAFVLAALLAPSLPGLIGLFGLSALALLASSSRPSLVPGRLLLVTACAALFGLISLRGHFYGPSSGAPTDWTQAIGPAARHGLRIAVVFTSAMVAGQLSGPRAWVEAVVTHFKLPYRPGFAALSSLTLFVYLNQQRHLIRTAQSLRRRAPAGPLGRIGLALSGPWAVSLPLLAQAIRFSQRMAWAMTARAFGAYPTRTLERPYRWRLADSAAVGLTGLAAGVACLPFGGG
jgi:energy-coupling factor transport system ATP-binding protein